MIDIMVIEFQQEFALLNLDMMKNDIKMYDMAIITAYTLELDKGFIVKRQGKTTKKGTKFTYKVCESEEEANKYKTKLDRMLNEYNEKYNTNYHF